MKRTSRRSGALAAGFCLLLASTSLAQPEVHTTVDEVVSYGLVAVPNVGEGAQGYTIEDLTRAVEQVTRDRRNAERAIDACRMFGDAPQFEWAGDLNFEALYRTEEETQSVLLTAAQGALAATEKAVDVRAQAARGDATGGAVEGAELDRQKAVEGYMVARRAMLEARARIADYQYLVREKYPPTSRFGMMYVLGKERADVGGLEGLVIPREFADLRIHDVEAVEIELRGSAGLQITGQIQNTRDRTIGIPPISITLFDGNGFAVRVIEAQAGRRGARIAPGQSETFTYTLRDTPANTAQAFVTFAARTPARIYEPSTWRC